VKKIPPNFIRIRLATTEPLAFWGGGPNNNNNNKNNKKKKMTSDMRSVPDLGCRVRCVWVATCKLQRFSFGRASFIWPGGSHGLTENDGHENDGQKWRQNAKLQENKQSFNSVKIFKPKTT